MIKIFYNAKALIIGPDETPYKNGFYFFDINYTDKYPQEPPKVLLCTLNKRTRFNPNLYMEEKYVYQFWHLEWTRMDSLPFYM